MYTDTPEMPLRSTPCIHRSHDQIVFCYSACVARAVDRKERAANPKAKAALDKEWNKLITQGYWDYSSVREWSHLLAEARKTGAVAHFGGIFDICVEKLLRLTSFLVAGSVRVLVVANGAYNRRVGTLQICAQGRSLGLVCSPPRAVLATKSCSRFLAP